MQRLIKGASMKRNIGVVLLGLGCLLATHAFSATQHTFQIGPAVDYELPINDPQVFSNVFMWTVKASCTIKSTEANNIVSFKVLRKTGSINNRNLSSGDVMTLTLQPREVVYITALPGAKVELLNQGSTTIVASCTAT